ncbi:MAG: bifunctional glutamate N-acetyltransferase/amino-acid acetyltransferase ArgJ [Clostridia bacterium]|nr:bifunctional glutamate N-acetyltransferase/amino-acid acetyltransferase ArgJ [Clostridia bacterium]
MGGITAPIGFLASGISAGVKKKNGPDIALIFSESPCAAAGVFTKNIVTGHSLDLCRANVANGCAQCIFINSGNANACIGQSGYEDARTIANQCAGILGITPGDVLTGSTGVIGHPLPMDRISAGITNAAAALSAEGGSDACRAIMTTDTYPKETAVEFDLGGFRTVLGGIAKGSGMIHPDMATMIGIITTDAFISSELLKKALIDSVGKSFNKISVDGDTSVCDMVLILANGMSGGPEITKGSKEYDVFKAALDHVSVHLAKAVAADGEGATKLIEINIRNARTPIDAARAAKAVANSPLVKTAFFGEDANWGRILTAAGSSGAVFDPNATTISIGPLVLYQNGTAIPFDEDEAACILKNKNIEVVIDFGDGAFSDTVWTCDLSHGYIDINANYRT